MSFEPLMNLSDDDFQDLVDEIASVRHGASPALERLLKSHLMPGVQSVAGRRVSRSIRLERER